MRQHGILAWMTSDEMCTALDVGKVCAGRVYEYTVVGWERTQAERGDNRLKVITERLSMYVVVGTCMHMRPCSRHMCGTWKWRGSE